MDELKYSGLILDDRTTSEEDYLLGDDLTGFDIKSDTPKFFYNQAKQDRTRNGCTNYAAIGCVSDLLGYEFSLEEILEIHDLAEKDYGRGEDWGNYLYKAVDCIRNYWNSKHDNQLISFRVNLTTTTAQKLIDGGKTIMIGYHTSVPFYKDSQDNGVMNTDSFSGVEQVGGHAIRYNFSDNIDNYIGVKKYNTYENRRLKSYVDEGTIYKYGYVFFEKEKTNAELAESLGFRNGKNKDEPATRFEVASMIGALYRKLNK